MLQNLDSAIFLKKEAAFGTELMDKILGNGFSVYAIVLGIYTGVVSQKNKPDNHLTEQPESPLYLTELKVKHGNKIYFLKTDAIDHIQASNNYVDIFVGDKKHVIRETLSHLEELLDPNHFIRIHRSSMVNVKAVEGFETLKNGQYHVKIKNKQTLKVGNTYREKVLTQFGLLA